MKSGVISLPSLSRALPMSMVAIILESTSQRLLSAKDLPGHTLNRVSVDCAKLEPGAIHLLPNPNTTFLGSNTSEASLSKLAPANLSGRKDSGSG